MVQDQQETQVLLVHQELLLAQLVKQAQLAELAQQELRLLEQTLI